MEWPDFLVCEPILQWPGDATPEHARTWSQFRAKMPTTVKELRHELEMLRAVRPVLRVGVRPRDVRQDGFPRADARLEHPGVILVFNREARSKEFTSRAAARDYLRRVAGAAPGATDKALYRLAAKATHPDVGGTQEEAARVTAAWALLTQEDTFQLACDRYIDWTDNLRAITKTLDALRAARRYGVLQGDEQYAGFKQLAAGPAS
jgi:hypothetical protein